MKMQNLKFGVGISVYNSTETVRLGTLAEKVGYDSAWIADHLVDTEACKIDPWVVLGAIGVQTSRLVLGTAVTDALRVHPAKLAQIVATLDEMTKGRAILGLGSGEVMNTAAFGIGWEKPAERIRRLVEAVKVIRLLWKSSREKPVDFDGNYYSLKNAWLDQIYSSVPHPKIYLGALHSSELLKVTGELADGWLDFLSTPSLYGNKVSKIREGAESSGRKLDDIDRTVWLGVAFTSDPNELSGGIGVMKFLLTSERSSLRRMGIDVSIPEEKKYINCMPTRSVLDETAKASARVEDEIAKQFMIYGEGVQEAVDMLDEFVKAGATHFEFSMLTPKSDEMMRRFAEKVLKAYR